MAQGDKITKKIRRDQPKKDSFGQYTYRNGQPKSNPPSNHKFFDRDLYSTIETSDINEAILNTPGDIDIRGDSYIRIDMLEIENAGVSYGLIFLSSFSINSIYIIIKTYLNI